MSFENIDITFFITVQALTFILLKITTLWLGIDSRITDMEVIVTKYQDIFLIFVKAHNISDLKVDICSFSENS